MLNIAICDDENVIVNQMEAVLEAVCSEKGIAKNINVFYSGAALEKEILCGTSYDIIFLDIQMAAGDGISAAGKIRELDKNVLFVFVSGYDRYLMELFRLDVFEFIKKPVNEQLLAKTLLNAYQKICDNMAFFDFHCKNEDCKVLCRDILYMESSGRKVKIYLCNGEVCSFYGKLSDAEERLARGKLAFMRIHQSYLVNFFWIKSKTKTQVTLTTGKKLPVSEERQKTIDRTWTKLLGGEISD